MKKLIFIIVIFISLTISFNSCKKDTSTTSTTPPPTQLQITVTDNLGNIVTGATVTLYSDKTDWQNQTNALYTAQTDANGKVTFSNLSTIIYYWYAQSGCKNNFYNGICTTNPLTANITNTVTAIINSTGFVEFISTSSNPYYCYIDGTNVYTLNGGLNYTYPNPLPIGNHEVKVVQVSGYILYPTIDSTSANITCGNTFQYTFPTKKK